MNKLNYTNIFWLTFINTNQVVIEINPVVHYVLNIHVLLCKKEIVNIKYFVYTCETKQHTISMLVKFLNI